MISPLRRLYDKVLDLSARPDALWWLAAVAFTESFIFPIPQDVMMIPMILAAPTRAWRIVAVASVASAFGGLTGYAIGAGLYETVGRPLLELYGYGGQYGTFKIWYEQWGAWIVAAGAFTPLPYKVITIASGAAQMDLLLFFVAAFPTRIVRFILLAWILVRFGPPVRRFVEKRFGLATGLGFLILIGGFALVKLF